MEDNVQSSHATELQTLESPSSVDKKKKENPDEAGSPTFVNHAAIAWHENRRKWIGDQSRGTKRVPEDPVICWTMTYEDLATSEPFPQPIPLSWRNLMKAVGLTATFLLEALFLFLWRENKKIERWLIFWLILGMMMACLISHGAVCVTCELGGVEVNAVDTSSSSLKGLEGLIWKLS